MNDGVSFFYSQLCIKKFLARRKNLDFMMYQDCTYKGDDIAP